MESNKEFSDFSLKREECPKCGAVWLNGQHTWATGNKGDEESLANLVCSQTPQVPGCVNSKFKKGHVYGDKETWEKRANFINNELPKLIEDAERKFRPD